MFGVIVGRIGVFVEIKARKAARSFDIGWVGGVGKTEEIEINVAFGLMKLIIAKFIFLVYKPKCC
jgi:hypothetical protein